MAIPVSACIICKNAAHLIGRALDSVAWCGEIVVVDSGSTDGTVEICRGHGSGKVRVVSEAWRGYNQQRKYAVELCGNEWVLMLDADEECSGELKAAMEGLGEGELAGAAIFEMPRKNYVAGRYVRCWSPDYQTRLVHQERVEWGEQALPEVRRAKAGFVVKRLKGAILHNRLTAVSRLDFCNGAMMEERAGALAEAMEQRGRRATFFQLLTRPGLTFLKYYIIKGAFLDGRFGLVMAYRAAVGATLKYSVLYGREIEAEQKAKRE